MFSPFFENVVNHQLDELNQSQKEAVSYKGGPLLVLAGAGSGKTRVLTHRAAWFITSKQASPEELLLLTFTNKAAEEMRNRLQIILDNSRLSKSKEYISRAFAGTFHSFGAYVLRREGGRIGITNSFVIFDEDDQKALVKEIMGELGLSEKKFSITTIIAVIEGAKSNLIDSTLFAESVRNPWEETIGKVYQLYDKKMLSMSALDFADLLFWTVKLFRDHKETLEKYQDKFRYILVDEYQDTNRSQYILTKLLAGKHRNLTVVGDAAQAIYSWRGADYHNLISLKDDFKDLKIINLDINYRSTQTILDAAYCVISKNELHPVLHLTGQKGQGEKAVVIEADSEVDEAELIAEEIKTMVDFSGQDPTKIAILYRTNAQSRAIEEVFIRRGLPYVLVGGVRFYDRAEVKNVLAMIRVYHNNKDMVSWQRIEKNLGKRRKEKIRIFCGDSKNKRLKVKELIERILASSDYLAKFDSHKEEDARRLENIKELLSVAEHFSELDEFLENVALVQQEYSVQEKEKKHWEHEAVKLMTLHSSKGLEFDIVFLVGLEEGLLPHSQNLEEMEKLEEERRLCYVGMTRAKKKLYLTYARRRLFFGRTTFNDPSRFLQDIEQNLLDKKESIGDWSFSDPSDDW